MKINSKYIIFLLLIITVCATQELHSQVGTPFLRNYLPKDYEGENQNWTIVQDKRGIMYFGNAYGVLEYDGANWRTIPLANCSTVRSLAVDSTGRIFVGGVEELGYLGEDSLFNLKYISLKSKIDSSIEFADIWKIVILDNCVFSRTNEYLFAWDGSEMQIHKPYPKSSFFTTIVANNSLITQQRNYGLLKLQEDSIKIIQGTEKLGSEPVYSILPYSDNKMLLGTRNEGLFIMDFTDPLKVNITEFSTKADKYLLKNKIYCGEELGNDQFAFGTLQGGVVIIDSAGTVVNIINKTKGLRDDNVWSLYQDKQHQLWIAHDNGVSKLDLSTPTLYLGKQNKLDGSIQSISRFNGILYVGTTKGVYYLDNTEISEVSRVGQFVKIEALGFKAWKLLPLNDRLIVSTNDGVFEVSDEEIKQLNDFGCRSLVQSNVNKNRIYLGVTNYGLTSLLWKNNTWIKEQRILQLNDEIRSMAEDSSGALWLGTKYSGVIHVNFENKDYYENKLSPEQASPKITYYNTPDVIPDGEKTIFKFGNKILIGTNDGFYKVAIKNNAKGDNLKIIFTKDTSFVFSFSEGHIPTFTHFTQNANGNIALSDGKSVFVGKNNEGVFVWQDFPDLRAKNEFIDYLYLENNDILWVGINDELMCINTNASMKKEVEFSTLIRNVIIDDDVVFGGAYYRMNETLSVAQSHNLSRKINYSQKAIRIEYSASNFMYEEGNKFKYKLEGFTGNWSDWEEATYKEYTNLSEGKYIFHVKSKNIYGHEGKLATCEFHILPPWYRTGWAYLAYSLLFTILMYLSVRISTRRLLAAKKRLRSVVYERTQEIVIKNEELEKFNNQLGQINLELAKKNRSISESLNYAQRIQETIMPTQKHLQKEFPESFIFYKAKEAVSGDFPWVLKNENNFFAAAVDCTGHGVPGAMMSMIGYFLLNDIVGGKKIHDPAKVLEQLHEGIKQTLRQEENLESQDGMDIALCAINKETREVYYAGAHRSLLWLHNGEIEEIRGDRFPVGGLQYSSRGKEIKFKHHRLQLEKGDSIYFYSDGLIDQIGGPKGRRFQNGQVKEIIKENKNKSMDELKDVFNDRFNKWMGSEKQLDDVIMLGIKV
ncbi:MAG: SpoIIE family protein phosphatase [Bacteroidia bacterium]|nr:SpoIIE family protein phosphatase [Bacteroidia bacterium]